MVRNLGLALVGLLSIAGCAASGDDDSTAGRFDDQTAAPARNDDADKDKTDTAEGTPDGTKTATSPTTPTTPTTPTAPTTPTTAADTSTCRAPHDIGSLSGDTGAFSTTAQGTCSEWLRVRMTEDSHNVVVAGQMKITATLLSPATENFDVYLYVNADTDALECTTVAAKSEAGPGKSDIAKTAWGEYYTPNASDDSRYVSIEVRNRAGGCATTPWSLVVQGNY